MAMAATAFGALTSAAVFNKEKSSWPVTSGNRDQHHRHHHHHHHHQLRVVWPDYNAGAKGKGEHLLSRTPPFSFPSPRTRTRTPAVRHLTGSLTATDGLRFAIVVARFNEIVTKPLLEGALETFKKYSVKDEDIDVVWVPGSFEIAVVAERLGKSRKYQAVLCIGAVIRGDTTHYDAVANSAASGVLSAGLNSGTPCIFGVLTCDDMEQALNRAGGKSGNKGSEAALTAIEMASLFEHHLK